MSTVLNKVPCMQSRPQFARRRSRVCDLQGLGFLLWVLFGAQAFPRSVHPIKTGADKRSDRSNPRISMVIDAPRKMQIGLSWASSKGTVGATRHRGGPGQGAGGTNSAQIASAAQIAGPLVASDNPNY